MNSIILNKVSQKKNKYFRASLKPQKDRHCEGGIPMAIGEAILVQRTEIGIASLRPAITERLVEKPFISCRAFIFCILLFSGCFEEVWAADIPMLERTITISIVQERIDEALKKISQQGGFTFSYNPAIIDVKKEVTFNFSNKTIREVLDELFDGDIDYKERKT